MPVDTSSYYPEVPGNGNDGYSLNNREGSILEPSPSPEPVATPQTLPSDGGQTTMPDDDSPQPIPDTNGVEKTMTGISHFLSWVLVPLLMPVYGLLFAFNLSILDFAPFGMKLNYTLIIFALDTILPMALVIVLKMLGYVSDYGLNGRRERLLPYILMVAAYGGSAWFMAAKGAPIWLSMFFAGGAAAAFVNMLVNFKWKISAHAAGIAGVVALLIRIAKDGWASPDAYFWLLASVVLAGMLGSARVWLGRHTVWQVLAGYAVGFCAVFFLTMIK